MHCRAGDRAGDECRFRLVQGLDAVETSVNLYGFSMGIIVLCLTQSFAHGAALEQDVEGLV